MQKPLFLYDVNKESKKKILEKRIHVFLVTFCTWIFAAWGKNKKTRIISYIHIRKKIFWIKISCVVIHICLSYESLCHFINNKVIQFQTCLLIIKETLYKALLHLSWKTPKISSTYSTVHTGAVAKMKILIVLCCLLGLTNGFLFPKIKTVEKLDIDKYTGRWYEVWL